MADNPGLGPGIYNIDYYSGSQVAVYIGSILVDEVTSISFNVQQGKAPLYGYADTYYRTVTKGQVLVQGSFTINFKEAGYLWLALNEYRRLEGKKFVGMKSPFEDSATLLRRNVEKIIEHNSTEDKYFIKKRNEAIQQMAAETYWTESQSRLSLGGYPGGGRFPGTNTMGNAENIFETFEDAIWNNGRVRAEFNLDDLHRRPDEPALNGFDIYLAYGDFIGDNKLNHTIRKIENIHILGWGQEVVINGAPLQESYSFIARNII